MTGVTKNPNSGRWVMTISDLRYKTDEIELNS